MKHYPQLSTGATVQYPFQIEREFRTVTNQCLDGSRVRFEDWGAKRTSWTLEYTALTSEEWNSIQALHADVEGRLGTFVFFDPCENLLAWSEELDRTVWVADPYLSITSGATDPLGGTNGTRLANAGAADQRLIQLVDVPGDYATALSIWVRSDGATTVELLRMSGGFVETHSVRVTNRWQRVSFGGHGNGTGLTTEFGLTLAAGKAVEVFGAQVETQPTPSPYKRTETKTGVHRLVRFLDDKLEAWGEGVDRFRVTVRLEALAGA